MPFWLILPATTYDRPHTVRRNNIPDLLTMLVDITFRLIYAGAHKICIVICKHVPPIAEINVEPQNVSLEARKNEPKNSTVIPDEGSILELEQIQKQKTFTRSDIQHGTTIDNLPGDLLSNIFIRLLAKQLAQLRSVSKSWNALLSESSFVKSHLHHSITNKDRILLLFYNENSDDDEDEDGDDNDDYDYHYDGPEPFTAHLCQSPHVELSNFIEPPLDNLNDEYTTSKIAIIGSVHGLICSRYGYDIIHIWNPSLSAMSTLPPHFIPSRGSYEINFQFGFDPKTEDYKVVKLVGLTEPPSQYATKEYVVTEWLQVEVFSMRKGSWKFITQSFPSHILVIGDHDYVCLDGHDGHLHWPGYIDEEGKLQTIVAFDLGSETFREIPFPDSLRDGKCSNLIGFLGGKLCVMSWYEGDDVCNVWVMDVYGVAKSWVKQHVLSPIRGDWIYGFTSHNELIVGDDDCHLVSYDPTAQKDKILEQFYIGNRMVGTVVEYVDSLVWVAPTKHGMVDGA